MQFLSGPRPRNEWDESPSCYIRFLEFVASEWKRTIVASLFKRDHGELGSSPHSHQERKYGQ